MIGFEYAMNRLIFPYFIPVDILLVRKQDDFLLVT